MPWLHLVICRTLVVLRCLVELSLLLPVDCMFCTECEQHLPSLPLEGEGFALFLSLLCNFSLGPPVLLFFLFLSVGTARDGTHPHVTTQPPMQNARCWDLL